MADAGGLGGLLGGLFSRESIGGQLFMWGVLEAVLQASATPAINEIQQDALDLAPNVLLTPTSAAALVAQGFIDRDTGAGEARRSGIEGDRFDNLVNLARNAIPAAEAAHALFLGLIQQGDGDPASATFTGALASAGIRKEWWPILQQLAQQWPTPNDALQANLQGYFTDNAQGKALFQRLGGNPDFYDMLFYINGTAPTPTELLELWNRGIIPQDSGDPTKPGYVQGFLQGPWRNEWLPVFEALREYLPPPRTITAMLREGALGVDQATTLLEKQGLTPDLAAAYVADATHQKVAADKLLTESAIVALYESRVIGQAEATTLLAGIGYDATEAGYLLTLADMRVEIASINRAITTVETAYVGHKIDRPVAQAALSTLGVPQSQIGAVLNTWDQARAATVKVLTESQIVDAWAINILTQDQAITELTNIGYSAFDAWTLLSIKNKKALPGQPPAGAGRVNP